MPPLKPAMTIRHAYQHGDPEFQEIERPVEPWICRSKGIATSEIPSRAQHLSDDA
jgi:hypothetical protein